MEAGLELGKVFSREVVWRASGGHVVEGRHRRRSGLPVSQKHKALWPAATFLHNRTTSMPVWRSQSAVVGMRVGKVAAVSGQGALSAQQPVLRGAQHAPPREPRSCCLV